MAEQALDVLEQYDLEIRGVRKGRGSWIVNCREGDFVLKECRGNTERIYIQKAITKKVSQETGILAQEIVPDKEGRLLVRDTEDKGYMLQTFLEGRECNLKESGECEAAVQTMARMHKGMELSQGELSDALKACLREKERSAVSVGLGEMPAMSDGTGPLKTAARVMEFAPFSLQREFAKHNTELRRIRRYLKEKRQKNEFERFLHKNLPYFFEKALEAEENWAYYESCYSVHGIECLEMNVAEKPESALKVASPNIQFCHGDFQHHNVWLNDREIMILQFEKFLPDLPCRDLYLFLRKLLEKNNWNIALGREMLKVYEKERPLPFEERISMIYRFAYPEKFWKIANYYFNSKKSFVPEKSMEKLEKLLEQECAKEAFLNEVLRSYA